MKFELKFDVQASSEYYRNSVFDWFLIPSESVCFNKLKKIVVVVSPHGTHVWKIDCAPRFREFQIFKIVRHFPSNSSWYFKWSKMAKMAFPSCVVMFHVACVALIFHIYSYQYKIRRSQQDMKVTECRYLISLATCSFDAGFWKRSIYKWILHVARACDLWCRTLKYSCVCVLALLS